MSWNHEWNLSHAQGEQSSHLSEVRDQSLVDVLDRSGGFRLSVCVNPCFQSLK